MLYGISGLAGQAHLEPNWRVIVAYLGSFHYHLIAVFHGNHSPDCSALHKPFRRAVLGSPGFFQKESSGIIYNKINVILIVQYPFKTEIWNSDLWSNYSLRKALKFYFEK